MAALLPFALLFAALGLFLLSTWQRLRRWRFPVLLAGTLLLLLAAIENLSSGESTGLLWTLVRHPQIVTAAFHGNWPSVGAFAGPTLDMLLLLAVALGACCLIALTPGESVERVIRPVNIALIGAVAGAAIVLTLSAVGFGPAAKRQVFIAYLGQDDVIDGDTIRMGDVTLRLWGIDAPEDGQICLDANFAPFDCGLRAADTVRKLAAPGPVFCHAPEGIDAAGKVSAQLKESYGRPLVTCGSDQQGYSRLPDIERELVAQGIAYSYESTDGEIDSNYVPELQKALDDRQGFHAGVFLKPTLWRNDRHARCHLIAMAEVGIDSPLAIEPDGVKQRLVRLRKDCGLPD